MDCWLVPEWMIAYRGRYYETFTNMQLELQCIISAVHCPDDRDTNDEMGRTLAYGIAVIADYILKTVQEEDH